MCKQVSIYRFINTVNNKSYIGSTNNISHRVATHKCACNSPKYIDQKFYRAVRKYGWDNFKLEILEDSVCPIVDIRNMRENYWILHFKTLDDEFGYNLKLADCKNVSKETCAKIGKANLGRKASDETKQKQREAKLGKPSSRKNYKASEETLHKQRLSHLGHKDSEETKRKKSAAHIGRIVTQETIDKIKTANTGKTRTEEQKALLSKIHTGLPWSDKRREAYERNKILNQKTPEEILLRNREYCKKSNLKRRMNRLCDIAARKEPLNG